MPPRRLTKAESQAQTRERLLEAAAHVFAEKGFGASSLEDIAAEAGLTKGAVYSNFESKEDLMVASLARATGSAVDLSMFEGEGTLNEKVRAFGRSIAGVATDKQMANQAEFTALAVRNERARAVYGALARGVLTELGDQVQAGMGTLGEDEEFSGRDLVVVIDALIQGLLLRRAVVPDLVDDDLIERAIALLMSAFIIGITDADRALELRAILDEPT